METQSCISSINLYYYNQSVRHFFNVADLQLLTNPKNFVMIAHRFTNFVKFAV